MKYILLIILGIHLFAYSVDTTFNGYMAIWGTIFMSGGIIWALIENAPNIDR